LEKKAQAKGDGRGQADDDERGPPAILASLGE
jgi:hypothetical protein